MENKAPRFSNMHRRATCAALYAVGMAVGENGVLRLELLSGLAKHLEQSTFNGLITELEQLRIIKVVDYDFGTVIERGSEYADGLERLRLLGDSLKDEEANLRRPR